MNDSDASGGADQDRAIVERLVQASPEDRAAMVLALLRERIAAVLEIGAKDVDPAASLVELGVDSMQALRLRARLERLLGVEVPASALWDHDLAGIAAELAAWLAVRSPLGERVARSEATADRDGLTPAERRVWYLDQLLKEVPFYLTRVVIAIEGPLDVDRLRTSLSAIVARHPALRVRYAATSDGRPERRVGGVEGAWALTVHDLRELAEGERTHEMDTRIADLSTRGIDLRHGPFVDLALFRVDECAHRLLVRTHHIQSDGFSLRLLLAEVEAGYAGATLGAPSSAPAPWSAPTFADRDAARCAAWTARLAARPLPPPLFEVAPCGARGYEGGVVPFRLRPAIAEGLRALSRSHGVTLFTTVLAVFFGVLREATGERDLLLTTVLANRGWPDAEHCVGYLSNLVVVRTDLEGAATFDDVLARVREAVHEARQDEAFLLERLVHHVHAELRQDPTPFMQVCVVFDDFASGRTSSSGSLTWTIVPGGARHVDAHREITLVASPSEEHGIEGVIQYKRRVIDDDAARAFTHAYAIALERAAAGDELPASSSAHLPIRAARRVTSRYTELTAAYVVAGAPDVKPLDDVVRLVERAR